MNGNNSLNIDFIEYNLRNGRKTFSFSDLVKYKGNNNNAAKQYIKYSKKKKLIKVLAAGYYAIYSPPEKDSGIVSPADFIVRLMEFKRINYYTGLLSAASFYGAAHHRPAVWQVITGKQFFVSGDLLKGVSFHSKKSFPGHCIVKQKGNYGYINYSSPALTAFDLIKYEYESGTISNVILVISEILPQIKISDIKDLLKNDLEISYIQRLGFILEKLNSRELIKPLFEFSGNAASYIPLSRLGNNSGAKNKKWKIIENVNWKEFLDT